MKPFYRLSLIVLVLSAFSIACEEVGELNITPTADLDFVVLNATFNPVEDARIYLFPNQNMYDAYLLENPDGSDQFDPGLAASRIGRTDSAGQFIFTNYTLEGTEFASGNTFIHRPNPIYFRIEASITDQNGTTYLTNDGTDFKLTFDELENGIKILEEIDGLEELAEGSP